MADLSTKTASIYINRAPAEEALKKLQHQADKLSESIKKGQDAGKGMVNEIKKLNTVKDSIAGVQRQIDQGLKPSFNQLAALVAKTRAELKKMSESDAGFKQKTKELNKYSTEMSRLGKQIGAVKKEGGGIGSLLGGVGPALGGAAAAAAVISFFKGATEAALEADKIAGQFMGTLQNLGKADAFDRLTEKANQMAKRFKFIDDADVLNVFDKMLTYGKLTEAQMTALLPVIINFSVKSKQSLDQAATTIIKALDGTGRELKQYGVEVSASKTMTENLSAVMNDLGKNVAGAADAFGETTQGQIATTRQEIDKLKENIGTDLLPFLRGFYSIVSDIVTSLKVTFSNTKKFFSFISGDVGKFVADSIIEQAEELNKKQAEFAENIATELGLKSLEDQKRLTEGYKAMYISSRKELSAFLQSANKNDEKERKRLTDQVTQDGRIFIAAQRTVQDSIDTAKKNSSEKATTLDKKTNASREAAMKKAAEDARRLQEIWKEFSARIFDPTALEQDDPIAIAFKRVRDQAEKDIALTKDLYAKRVIDHQVYSEAILRIEKIRFKSMDDLAKKYKLDFGDSSFMPGQTQGSQVKPLAAGALSVDPKAQQKMLSDQQKLFRNSLAGEELQSIVSTGRKRLDAQLNVLELQKAAELANKDLTENEKFLIEEQYRQKRKDAEVSFQENIAGTILDIAQQVAGIMSLFSGAQNAADQEALADNQRMYDEDKNKLDKQLRQKVVSQKEYDRQIRALDDKKRKEDAAIKAKQFERDQRAQIVQAIMAGAGAVINALKAPPPLSFIFAGLAGAMVAAQIATIASQKAPQFAKGALLDGPAHSAGGMPIMKHGRKVAEVEGGEAILSKRTVKNNWDIVSELLNTSMYGNGARLVPYSQTRSKYRPINYSAISRSMDNVRMFEKGGLLKGGTTSAGNDPVIEIAETLANLNPVINQLNSAISFSIETSIALQNKLSEPFKSYTLLSESNAAQQMMDRIRKETTISRKN